MKFQKMHGCGNCYIYVNCFEENVPNPEEVSIMVSDIRKGIGSDGLILIKPSDKADFFMDIYNLDGSRAKMCGNGVRCVGKYVYDNGLTDKTSITVDTLSGIKYLDLVVENGKVSQVRVDMGAPILTPAEIPVDLSQVKGEVKSAGAATKASLSANGNDYEFTFVSMGNPHAVTFVEDAEKANVLTDGPVLEFDKAFPERCNIEFCNIISRSEVRMRVWERGSGETWACGTGACATAVACYLNGYTDSKVAVNMNGGTVVIEYDEANNKVYMTGPAETICEGELFI